MIKPHNEEPVDGPKERWVAGMWVVKASIEVLKQTTRMQAPSARITNSGRGLRPSQKSTIDNCFVSLGERGSR